MRSRSTSGASRVRYSLIALVWAKIASVIFSGAGPPLPILYLMPKSPCGPPGLWLAERMMPPNALRPRITAEAAGVESRPPWPDQHPAEAVGRGHPDHLLDDLAVVVAAVAADHEGLALEALEAVEDRLDEVLDIVRLLEHRDLLAQARGAGLLVGERLGRDRDDRHGGPPGPCRLSGPVLPAARGRGHDSAWPAAPRRRCGSSPAPAAAASSPDRP